MRNASIHRQTAETDIRLTLCLEGRGDCQTQSGCGFLDHMLQLMARHGRFDLQVACRGDTWVDDHHTVEDIGIALGQAFGKALGDRRGVRRYGQRLLPMDEALVLAAVDLSGRGFLAMDLALPCAKVGTFDTELVREFFQAVAREAGLTLHLRLISGLNTHHIIEAAFKGFGQDMREACSLDPQHPDDIPSTKGTLGGEGA